MFVSSSDIKQNVPPGESYNGHTFNPEVPSSEHLLRWSEIQPLTDQDICDIHSKSSVNITQGGFQSTTVRQIAQDVVTKVAEITPSEVLMMDVVRKTTDILVPKPLHYCGIGPKWQLLAMEYIRGRTLESCWDDLSWFRKLVIIWTLRRYVRQLRRATTVAIGHSKFRPGPIGSEPTECLGMFFSFYNAGPFETYSELIAWLNHKRDVTIRMKHAPASSPIVDTSYPLVLTHNDLGPSNILLDEQNRVWIIDWGNSGLYPIWMEYCIMRTWWSKYRFGRFAAAFIAGYYPVHLKFFRVIAWALDHAPFTL